MSGFPGRLLAFSSDSKLLATIRTAHGESAVVWDVTTRAEVANWPLPPGTTALAFELTGGHLATANRDAIAPWDVTTRTRIRSFVGPTARVDALAFAPDGRWLAAATQDGAIIFWDTAREEKVATLWVLRASGDWLLVTRDDHFDGTEAAIRSLVAWRRGCPRRGGGARPGARKRTPRVR